MMYVIGGAAVYVAGFALFMGVDYIKFDRIDPLDWETNLLWPVARPCIWFMELSSWLDRAVRPD